MAFGYNHPGIAAAAKHAIERGAAPAVEGDDAPAAAEHAIDGIPDVAGTGDTHPVEWDTPGDAAEHAIERGAMTSCPSAAEATCRRTCTSTRGST